MLKGKNAIITGGVRGIGLGIAKAFCIQGANVMLLYKSNDEKANTVKEELLSFGTKVDVLKCDVTNFDDVAKTINISKEFLGSIDVLVNNAGITKDGLIMRMSEDDFESVIDANLKGTFNVTRNVIPVMVKQKFGSVINISSISGVKGNPGQVNYSASKAGINGFTMALAKEVGKRGIRVNSIAPGFIETDMTDALNEDQKKKMLEAISLGRLGKVDDVANLAVFLASECSCYITGQVILIDGGMSI